MKAIVQDTYGTPEVLALEDIDKPAVGDDEVLLRVHAAGTHIGDWHIMTGLPYLMRIGGSGLRAPKARVRGTDVAGRVEAVGKDVTEFQPDDAVFGSCNGSFAEYATARKDKVVPKPGNLTFEQAAAVPTSGSTALQGLRDVGKVQAGQKVLIIGAAGGVGSFAVQIAKAFGAHVTGVCSTTKVDLVRSIGADASSTTPATISRRRGNAMTSSSTLRATVRWHTSGEPLRPGEPSSLSEPKGAEGGLEESTASSVRTCCRRS
jgi:NADPH:quinone reductase-like Zn-dependent oxidoreductase